MTDLDRARLHSRYRLRELERVAAENVNRAVLEARSDDELQPHRRWVDPNGGDRAKLRGVPISGYGGHTPGSAPHFAIESVRLDSVLFGIG